MAKNFCIPKEFISKIAKAMKDVGGKRLTEMKFSELHDFFSEQMPNDSRLAVEVARSFREAVISKRKAGLMKWMQENLTGKEIKRYEKSFEHVQLDKEYKQLLKDKFPNEKTDKQIQENIDKLTEKLASLRKGTYEKKSINKREPTPEEISLRNEIDKEMEKLNEKTIDVTEEKVIMRAIGVGVTKEEVGAINALHKLAKDKENELKNDPNNYQKRIEYGKSLLDMYKFVEERSPQQDLLHPRTIRELLLASKSFASTLDLSAPLRQGRGAMHKLDWYRGIIPMFKYFAKEEHYDLLKADILTRPNYRMARKAGLRISLLEKRITQKEDNFMSNLSKKIPLVDRSERAYVGFLSELRMNLFDQFVSIAKQNGEDVNFGSENLKRIASTINTMTGSGNIGFQDNQARLVPFLNTLFFSPRKVSSDVNMLTALGYPLIGKLKTTADREMFKASLQKIVTTLAVVALWDTLSDDYDNLDPRSSDFLKIKSGGTRFDLMSSGGAIPVLVARFLTGKMVSSNTGKVYTLGQPVGYGDKIPTRDELLLNFARNKLAPLFSFLYTMASGENAVGKRFGDNPVANELFGKIPKNRDTEAYDDYVGRAMTEFGASYVPLGVSNIASTMMQDNDVSFAQLLSFVYEFFGGGSQTY